MNMTTLILWLCFSATPVLAQSIAPCAHCSAPAPLIGVGAPVAVAVGSVLLGAKLLKRIRSRKLVVTRGD
jgi:hypothetical protein